MINRIRSINRFLLVVIARRLKKNHIEERFKYPQLWYYMPRRWVEVKGMFYPNGQPMLRRAKPRLVIEWLCGVMTGHEISDTEKGYGGGGYIDRSCRWCDKSIKVPVPENTVDPLFKGLMGLIDPKYIEKKG